MRKSSLVTNTRIFFISRCCPDSLTTRIDALSEKPPTAPPKRAAAVRLPPKRPPIGPFGPSSGQPPRRHRGHASVDPRRPTDGRSSLRAARGSAAFSLALVGGEAARRRSRVRRHPPAPCGHGAHKEHARHAHLPRLRPENHRSEAHRKATCDGGREPEGGEGAAGARAALGAPPLDPRRRGCQKIRKGPTKITSNSRESGRA